MGMQLSEMGVEQSMIDMGLSENGINHPVLAILHRESSDQWREAGSFQENQYRKPNKMGDISDEGGY